MRSAFFGLGIATSALHAARGSLNVHAHNIANELTPGFSRQVAHQSATNPMRMMGGRGMVGTGTMITGIGQFRNVFLDNKFWHQNAVAGRFTTKAGSLNITQGILREGVEFGITREINNIFDAIQDATTSAGDLTFRRNLLHQMDSLTTHLNATYNQLRNQQQDLNEELGVTVRMINSIGRQIASLNNQISTMEMNGSRANDLRDRRNLLIDELSGLVNIEVRENEMNPDFAAGIVTDPRQSRLEKVILLDGMPFIQHTRMNELELRPRVTTNEDGARVNVARNPEDSSGLYDIFWANGMRFDMYSTSLSGTLRGLIDLRDGNGGNFAQFNMPVPPGNVNLGPPATVTINFDPTRRVDLAQSGFLDVQVGLRTFSIPFTEFDAHVNANGVITGGTFTLSQIELDAQLPANVGGVPINSVTDLFANASDITSARTSTFSGIPMYMARLNELARSLARAFNEGVLLNGESIVGPGGEPVFGHINGINLNGGRYVNGVFEPYDPPMLLFSYFHQDGGNWVFREHDPNEPFNAMNITAGNFFINPDILSDPRLMALADEFGSLPDGNQVLHSWLMIDDNRSLFREGRLLDFIASITGEVGIAGRQAETFAVGYWELMLTVDNQRMAYSGVDGDEEIAFVIKHQLVFQIAARLVSIIDELYDITINRMGAW